MKLGYAMAVLLASVPGVALADGFASPKAMVISGADICKKAAVQVGNGKIMVECKRTKSGYGKALADLDNVRWQTRGGKGTMTATDVKGDVFTIRVKKKELAVLKGAMVGNLGTGE